jgi:hyaluronan synthase
MTNLVLHLGHDTVYQATATVHTLVPERYGKLCKMYIRWSRSATREGFRALVFAPRRALAKGPLRGAAILLDALAQPVAVVSRSVSVLGGAWLAFASPLWLLRSLLVATLVALPYALVFLRSERSSEVLFGILYGWFALFGLFWIQPFATVTVRRRGWMTRG